MQRVSLLLALLGCCGWSASSSGVPLIAVRLESKANTLDGCVSCGCRVSGEMSPGETERWWLAFGVLQTDEKPPRQTVLPINQCGPGSFEALRTDFERTMGLPYAVVDLAITVPAQPEEPNLELQLKHRLLLGLDPGGMPTYAYSTQNRSYRLQQQTDITLPLLVADEQDVARLGVHEVLVRLRAIRLGADPARSYGSVIVRADVSGAEIMLEGGFVGRTTESPPFVLGNVPTGVAEISVRDFSGRQATRRVRVKREATAELVFDLLNMEQTGGLYPGLKPIGQNPQGYDEYWRAKDGAMLVRIPAGEFTMGSSRGEAHEQPVHQVYLSDFVIDKTEVTWRQVKKYTDAAGTEPPPVPLWGTPENHPASLISWHQAQAYCEWVGGRLPTEAEWEKAARGTDGRTFQWGNQWDPRRCNSISGGPHRPESAGSFPNCHSPYGVLDLAGSMWEWTRDWYRSDYYSESPSRDPKGPDAGQFNVVRGGGWMTQPGWLRTSYRFRLSPASRRPDLGFRCAHDFPEAGQ